VHFAHARPREDVPNIVLTDSTTRHDGYTITRLIDQPRDDINAFQSGGCAARSKDATHADFDEMFQRFGKIRSEIQRAVKSDGQSRTAFEQLACRRYVYSVVAMESADHDAGGAVPSGDLDVALHSIDFVNGINEVATTRPNEHEYGNPYALDYRSD
jgi:hypothetical protein